MIKLFCSPVVKSLLFLLGYVGAVSLLRSLSHTFHVLFGRFFGEWFHFGFHFSVFFLVLCIGFLFLSVWMTPGAVKKEATYGLWRNLDFVLLSLCGLLSMFFLLSAAHTEWRELYSLLPPTLAYLVAVLIGTEFVARIRDRDLLRTLYWVRFFRRYPVWRGTGLFFALLLAWNVIALFALIPTVAVFFRFQISVALRLLYPFRTEYWGRWGYDLNNIFLVAAALSILGLTYLAASIVQLSDGRDAANEERILAERFKSELITNVSHDIRTPLTSIINYVDLLKSQPITGEAAAYVSVLDRKSARLKTLIDDLMEASKAGSGNMSVTLEEVNLLELVGQVAGEFDEQFTQRHLTLVLREPDEPVYAYVDSRHLWRVLENLFSNAAKYTLTGTRVFAEITQGEGQIVFALKNISQDPIDLVGNALTEQFIRGDRARQTEGNGLGLYIAKSLVELMGGQFAIRASGDLFEVKIVFEEIVE
ncbi:MAG: HAMP domain-containing histidine kinase [Oscillospiraceae bacterium]|nr:HAMP domain-containing histidine kinase [Oscillospiraceae bacterium]